MIKEFRQSLENILGEFKNKLQEIRGHRLGLSFLENLDIEIYGQNYPLKSLGFISQLDVLTFRIEVFDENTIGEIETGIRNRNLNLSISREKKSLIVKFPPLTEETRKNLLKNLRELKEEMRIKARSLRDEFLRKLKNQKEKGEISEDEFYRNKDYLDKEIEEFNRKVDGLFQTKEKEILS